MKRLVFPCLLLGVTVALRADAKAPGDQYEQFIQDDVQITDHYTRLVWQRKASPAAASLVTAAAQCSLNFAGGRIPSIKELLTILDEDPHVEYEAGANVTKYLDVDAFYQEPVDAPYWTSTPASSSELWTLSFETGSMKPLDKNSGSALVRCVK